MKQTKWSFNPLLCACGHILKFIASVQSANIDFKNYYTVAHSGFDQSQSQFKSYYYIHIYLLSITLNETNSK